MSYAHADVQTLENTIRSGAITIEQGQAKLSEAITAASEAVERDEGQIKAAKEGIKGYEHVIEQLKNEYHRLTDEIGNLDSEATSARLNGDESGEVSARSLAEYYRKQREEVECQKKEWEAELKNLQEIKSEYEKQLENDQRSLDGLNDDKVKFDRECEAIETGNAEMRREADKIAAK